MILIKCCANCKYDDEDIYSDVTKKFYDDEDTCTVDCHCTTADDWCPRWEDEDDTERD